MFCCTKHRFGWIYERSIWWLTADYTPVSSFSSHNLEAWESSWKNEQDVTLPNIINITGHLVYYYSPWMRLLLTTCFFTCSSLIWARRRGRGWGGGAAATLFRLPWPSVCVVCFVFYPCPLGMFLNLIQSPCRSLLNRAGSRDWPRPQWVSRYVNIMSETTTKWWG